MPVKVKFLAVLRGLASKEEEDFELKEPVTLDELVKRVVERRVFWPLVEPVSYTHLTLPTTERV